MTPELRRMIRDVVLQEMDVILSGTAGSNTVEKENIDNMYPGMPTISDRPVAHPYGFASRAKKGTIQVVGKQGEHRGNRVVLGHRDVNRPSDLAEGESVMYSMGDYRIKIFKDKAMVSKGTDYEHMVVGDTLLEFLMMFLDLFINHSHIGNLGFPTDMPVNKTQAIQAKADYLTNNKILAKDGGRY